LKKRLWQASTEVHEITEETMWMLTLSPTLRIITALVKAKSILVN
jgi:hypothetical protein